MAYKTLEELFIDKFKQLEDKYNLLLIELDREKNNKAKADGETIILSDHTGLFYIVNNQNYYNYNDILNDNGYTPELIKKALSDETALIEFMKLPSKRSIWSGEKVAEVCTRTYQYLFKTDEHIGALTYNPNINEPFDMYNIDKDRYFLNKYKAEESAKAKTLEQIKRYFEQKYEEKFKPKDQENESNNEH